MIERDAVITALKQVIDPELGVNIVDLGLIYNVQIIGSAVMVDMTLTTPGCPLSGSLPDAAQRAVAGLPGVTKCAVDLVWSPPWTPDRITADGRSRLAGV